MTGVLGLQRFRHRSAKLLRHRQSLHARRIERGGARARGLPWWGENCTDEELTAMHARGVRALRLDLFLRSSWPTAEIIAYIERSVRRTRAIGWHVQFYTPDGWFAICCPSGRPRR